MIRGPVCMVRWADHEWLPAAPRPTLGSARAGPARHRATPRPRA